MGDECEAEIWDAAEARVLLVIGQLEGRATAGHAVQDALLSFTVFAPRTGVRMHSPHLRCMLELCAAAPACSDASPVQARELTRKCSGGQGWEAPGLPCTPCVLHLAAPASALACAHHARRPLPAATPRHATPRTVTPCGSPAQPPPRPRCAAAAGPKPTCAGG